MRLMRTSDLLRNDCFPRISMWGTFVAECSGSSKKFNVTNNFLHPGAYYSLTINLNLRHLLEEHCENCCFQRDIDINLKNNANRNVLMQQNCIKACVYNVSFVFLTNYFSFLSARIDKVFIWVCLYQWDWAKQKKHLSHYSLQND